MPDFDLEMGLAGRAGRPIPIVGIDEVGLGPIAGPMVVGGVALLAGAESWGLKDSKKLSPQRRETLFDRIITGSRLTSFHVAEAWEIDGDGVAATLERLMLGVFDDAVSVLGTQLGVIVDGYAHRGLKPWMGAFSMFVDKADDLSLSVAAASIVAKVHRDRVMVKLAARYPGYGWERNKGYPTPEHLAALRKLGPTPEHRKSYGPVARIVQSRQDGEA